MNCDDIRRQLNAHLDEELDVMHDSEIIAHLDACPACADAALAHAARRGLTREKLQRFTAPPDLEAQIRDSLSLPSPKVKPSSPSILRRLLPLAACMAIAGLGGYQAGVFQTRTRDSVDELTSSHVRSMMTGHSVDVASTSQHTVKPWFAGKIDFTPPVPDLAADGFPLIGGRLDQVEGTTAAVLVYQCRKHVIDLYVSPSAAKAPSGETSHRGFNIVAWTEGENHYAAVSDLALVELREFSRLWREQTRL